MSSIFSNLVNLNGNVTGTLAAANMAVAGSGAAGILSSGTQTITGVKTFETQLIGHGTSTSDSAATGYIGEYLENPRSSGTNTGASNAYFDGQSITLTAGDWDVSGSINFVAAGATFTSIALEVGISGKTGNDGSGLVITANDSLFAFTSSFTASFSQMTLAAPTVRVKCDGTNLIINGTTTTGLVVYLKGNIGNYTAGQPTYSAFIRARRVR